MFTSLRYVAVQVPPLTRSASLFMGVLHGTKVEPGYSLKVRWVHREDRQVVCYGGCGDHRVKSARLRLATSPS